MRGNWTDSICVEEVRRAADGGHQGSPRQDAVSAAWLPSGLGSVVPSGLVIKRKTNRQVRRINLSSRFPCRLRSLFSLNLDFAFIVNVMAVRERFTFQFK